MWPSSMNSSFRVSCITFLQRWSIRWVIATGFPSATAGMLTLCSRWSEKSISSPPLSTRSAIALHHHVPNMSELLLEVRLGETYENSTLIESSFDSEGRVSVAVILSTLLQVRSG